MQPVVTMLQCRLCPGNFPKFEILFPVQYLFNFDIRYIHFRRNDLKLILLKSGTPLLLGRKKKFSETLITKAFDNNHVAQKKIKCLVVEHMDVQTILTGCIITLVTIIL